MQRKAHNIGTLPELKITVFGLILKYKLSKYDAIGAIQIGDDTVAFAAIKSMLHYGIRAYLSYKGYNTVDMEEYATLKLLAFVDDTSEIYTCYKRILFSNDNSMENINRNFDECIALVEQKLIPKYIWQIMGEDDRVNWENWMSLIIELTKMMDFIGWANREIAPENSSAEWIKWEKVTKQVFGK